MDSVNAFEIDHAQEGGRANGFCRVLSAKDAILREEDFFLMKFFSGKIPANCILGWFMLNLLCKYTFPTKKNC